MLATPRSYTWRRVSIRPGGRRGFSRYHLSSFGSCNGEFQICIFLPVSEEERKLAEESVVDFAGRGYGLRARVAVQTAFKAFGCAHEALPGLEVIGVLELGVLSACGAQQRLVVNLPPRGSASSARQNHRREPKGQPWREASGSRVECEMRCADG